ncbi:MAG TPA: biotin/lipoyl-containing protein [Longimicrobium sp.]|nr:biotin/lipoyl-containing protein [Longimicrobium sp.]
MARVDVPMPQMGESIAEGTVSRWLKQVGDAVQRDEPILEISTDKVDAEIPSPAAGVLAEIVVQEGTTVEVGTIVARIETEAGAMAAAPAAVPTPGAAAGPSVVPGERETELPGAAVGQPGAGDAAPVTPAAATSSAHPVQQVGGSSNGDGTPSL